MLKIFRCNGQYFGFISGECLFTASGAYVGWIEGQTIWKSNGHLLGELVENAYIQKKQMQISPMPKIPRILPTSSIPPIPPINRIGKTPRIGWLDALEDLTS